MLNRAQVKEIRKEVRKPAVQMTAMFNALSDPGRFGIFRLFMKRRDLCVTEIAAVFDISVPAASQQLRVMEMSGLITKERRGQKVCYGLRGDRVVRSLIRIINQR